MYLDIYKYFYLFYPNKKLNFNLNNNISQMKMNAIIANTIII